MTKDLKMLAMQSAIADAAGALSDGKYHAAPVVDDAGNLIGLVTSTDLIRHLCDLF